MLTYLVFTSTHWSYLKAKAVLPDLFVLRWFVVSLFCFVCKENLFSVPNKQCLYIGFGNLPANCPFVGCVLVEFQMY